MFKNLAPKNITIEPTIKIKDNKQKYAPQPKSSIINALISGRVAAPTEAAEFIAMAAVPGATILLILSGR